MINLLESSDREIFGNLYKLFKIISYTNRTFKNVHNISKDKISDNSKLLNISLEYKDEIVQIVVYNGYINIEASNNLLNDIESLIIEKYPEYINIIK